MLDWLLSFCLVCFPTSDSFYLGQLLVTSISNTEKDTYQSCLEYQFFSWKCSIILSYLRKLSNSPDKVQEALTKEFTIVGERKMEVGEEGKEDDVMQLRTMVWEALVQITRELGNLTPKYKNNLLLLNAFLAFTNDPGLMVRSSNLGGCQLIRFS